MTSGPRRSHRTRILAAFLVAGALDACTFRATEVLVALDTDVPSSRPMTITATVRDGTATTGPGGGTHSWQRDGSDGGIALPASFAITPSAHGNADGVATLVVEASSPAGAHGEPAIHLRRVARFRFTLHQTTALPIFLPVSCATVTSGCQQATGDACTVSALCEEQGQTCGDQGQCVAPEVVPVPIERDADPVALIDSAHPEASTDVIDAVEAVDAVDAVDATTDGPSDIVCGAGEHLCGSTCALDTAPASCGTSCTPCPAITDSTATCTAGLCGYTCNAGFVSVGSSCEPMLPTQIAPLSGAMLTSARPLFRWTLPPGVDGAIITICRDHAMTVGCMGPMTVLATSVLVPAPLARGVWFWNLRGATGAAVSTAITPTWEVLVPSNEAPRSTQWGTFADFDRDGHADVVVGASGANSNAGIVYEFEAPGGVTATSPTNRLDSPLASAQFGRVVTPAGDVDGDGTIELLVTAPTATGGGRAYVYQLLGAGMMLLRQTLIGPDGSGFGDAAAALGDVNGDGYADIAIGTSTWSTNTGRVYVYYGSGTGIRATPDLTISGPDGTNAYFGSPIAGAGDVDGDGYSDLVVGENNYMSHQGRAWIYPGSATGPNVARAIAVTGMTGSWFGSAVTGAGDLNADGLSDFAVGAFGQSSVSGGVEVFLGTATFGTFVRMAIASPDGGAFGSWVTGVGDMNGDGFGDLGVAAQQYASSTGRAYVFFGGSTGPAAAPAVRYTGTTAGAAFGNRIHGAGDIDGDGLADIVVSQLSESMSVGQAFAFRGDASALSMTPSWSVTGYDGIGGHFGVSVCVAPPRRSRAAEFLVALAIPR